MHHAGKIAVHPVLTFAAEPGFASALDDVATAPAHCFLRAGWYRAAGSSGRTLVARREDGEVVAALPIVDRRVGPVRIREVAGIYWPFRFFPLASDGRVEELAALLRSPLARSALGLAWRVGPVLDDDPALRLLSRAARESGWTIVDRAVGTCHIVDLAGLPEGQAWPSTKTLRKNRWLERRLAESGPLEFVEVSGEEWTPAIFDGLARIESESWVGREADLRDTKFLHPANRQSWEKVAADARLKDQLACRILSVGGAPAAFTLTLRAGPTLHIIANSYSEAFQVGSPGRLLLYRELQEAREKGVARIGWGAGDPGYKAEMGARPGPRLIDRLLVRGPAVPLARWFWRGS